MIVQTDAYRWQGDTIYQNEFKAWAENPYQIRSTYKGRPGYFMPISQEWKRKNDLTPYPVLEGGNLLHRAIYNMALDEMVNAVEPTPHSAPQGMGRRVDTRRQLLDNPLDGRTAARGVDDLAYEEGESLGSDYPGYRFGRRMAHFDRPHGLGACHGRYIR